MPFELRQLRYAVAAADARSFARAARSLRVKQSTLSKRILLLEQRLGVALFQRTPHGVDPTQAGTEFLSVARRIVEDADWLHSRARALGHGNTGKLTIGFTTSLSAGQLRTTIHDFFRLFPDVTLSGFEAGFDELARGLATRSVDIAIVVGTLPGNDLINRHLWPERLMVALPDQHPLATQERIYWHDLRNEAFVLPRRDPGPHSAELIRSRLRDPGRTPNILLQDVNRENIIAMVALGHGITVAAETSAGAKYPGVVMREIHDATGLTHVDFSAWWQKDNDNPVLQRFFGVISERYPGFSSA